MDFSEIKELKFIFPQKKFCYFLTKLKTELWLMPGIRFFQYDSYQQGSIAPHAYDEDIKNMRDIYATRKFDEKRGREKGMKKGIAKGRAEGELAKGLEVARNLLAMGMSWSQIMQATGLTEDQLKQLQS